MYILIHAYYRPKRQQVKHRRNKNLMICCNINSVGGVTVSMVAFQAVDPGSTPGRRTFYRKMLRFFRFHSNVYFTDVFKMLLFLKNSHFHYNVKL